MNNVALSLPLDIIHLVHKPKISTHTYLGLEIIVFRKILCTY